MRKIHNLKQYQQIRKNLRNDLTPQELLLWSKLKKSQLGYKFRRQHSIGKYIIDFYCPSKKLAIEIDGIQHQDNHLYDFKRTSFLEKMGVRVLRFWNNEVNININGVIMNIEYALNINTTPPCRHPSSFEEGENI